MTKVREGKIDFLFSGIGTTRELYWKNTLTVPYKW